ncbi:Cross-pathway control protein 1 [Colletotrichum orbiculare MAFF 240422]|uniref:Cross-pathway control protein 1 n=1 Tax=Colletotrichum orbiculare (strain 104-T / ATCC 96160 / CBS 514.97 / LARS 414 / MAFF 240422) TaxID=1213857 RepID=A0A484G4K3_COLOR|nr:Cross-pathway control protein 1 [Colletotrichum orbiculare MAFF 240422]TDZ25101.1 Cross-pathway control protein 1 [Colletotrichum orbiculare MAFF 240422]
MDLQDLDFDDFTGFEGGASTTYSSPAIASVFDLNIETCSSQMGTVSPQDLMVHEPLSSAPNSSALTTLTSPSIWESPMSDMYDTSPNFADLDSGTGEGWFSLFPTESSPTKETLEENLEKLAECATNDAHSGGMASEAAGRKSDASPLLSPRHSSVAGVNPRKRDKPLPPIVVEDPNDVVAMKRARNTLAARKSRERKAQRFEHLEEKIRKLEAERDHWKNIALGK